MAFRRGFKTEAIEIGREIRAELGLSILDALDPWALAEHLEIPVSPLSKLRPYAPEAVRILRDAGRKSFSAVTVMDGAQRVIVHNDSHHLTRQVSNIAHELSHGLLLHPPTPALTADGYRGFDSSIEGEASWLGGVLLIPDEAAISIVKRGLSLEDAARLYGVSRPMMRWRIVASAAHTRVARLGRKTAALI